MEYRVGGERVGGKQGAESGISAVDNKGKAGLSRLASFHQHPHNITRTTPAAPKRHSLTLQRFNDG
jgi:hypothetical protein